TKAGNEKHYKKYVVVQNDILQYPICVYRINENEYTALWMQCTHQGAELQVFGDKLQCPAHGSEFTNSGTVQGGPADRKLRTFPVTIEANKLKISLKAI
ncbi:MAG: ubiquinol-cytochrome c reductase iron-sulfur subunit, partial [Sediminibacterium sp.]